MRNASGHNYWNSLFILDLAMGQIPRSTERISTLLRFYYGTIVIVSTSDQFNKNRIEHDVKTL